MLQFTEGCQGRPHENMTLLLKLGEKRARFANVHSKKQRARDRPMPGRPRDGFPSARLGSFSTTLIEILFDSEKSSTPGDCPMCQSR